MKRILPALALAASLSACASTPADFSGDWAYSSRCSLTFGHLVGFELRQTGDTVTGTWSEGDHRGRGEGGHLEGVVRDGGLDARMCVNTGEYAAHTCPAFDPQVHRFTLEDGRLAWYRPTGNQGHAHWVTLPSADESSDAEAEQAECDPPAD